ncbi:MAG: SMP-30/gluconolactonase/LRE family protein [Gemmatimonadota bacterium]
MENAYAKLAPRRVTEGLEFPEGPVALPDGSVLVTEIRGGRVTRVEPDGTRTTYADTGGGPNGAAFGPDGSLYVCNAGCARWAERDWPYSDPDAIRLLLPAGHLDEEPAPSIQRVRAGVVESLYVECGDQPLRRPNDIVFDSEGGFWFTDSGRGSARSRDLTGVYYAAADGSRIEEVIHPMEMPNGIGLSPDGQTLYVVETRTRRLWACTLAGPGRPKTRRGLATIPSGGPLNVGGCDSLCVDAEGNVIIATIGTGGVTGVSPDGDCVAHVPVDDPMTTNACFGGPDNRTLFVTAASTGELLAFEDWPVPGLPLAFDGGIVG